MKSILISIKPEWVAKILNGEKTIEIRKTAPKCELPIEVYIYCTKGEEKLIESLDLDDGPFFARNKEFFDNGNEYLNGKVLAKFTLKEIEECVNPYFPKGTFATKTMTYEGLLSKSQLTETEFSEYINKGARGYAWHISDLQLLDNLMKPSGFDNLMELSDFGLKRAPQSWCYVEEDD